MHIRFHHLSLKHKLMFLMMAIVLGALALSCAGLLFYQYNKLERHKVHQSSALADVITSNSVAALAFSDSRTANEVLSALRVQDDIIQAVIFGNDEKVFARYSRDKNNPDIDARFQGEDKSSIGNDDLKTTRLIKLDGKVVGKLVIQTDISQLRSDLRDFIDIVLGIMSLALLVALVLSSYFQNVISRPILALANLTRTVSESGDYSVRAQVSSGDEIGALTAGFNQMLGEIEKRESALQRAHDTLEERVLERTIELEEEVFIRRAVETALRREQELLQGVISNAPVAMAMLDNNMHYVAHSNQWLIDYGLSGSIIGKSHYDVFPDIPERWREIHRRAQAGEIVTCSEDIFERGDGQKIYLRWALHPWWKPDGVQGGVIVVTDRIDDLVRAREEALRAAQAKSQFFANVSHELRTPMNGVLGFTELLADSDLTEDQRGHLNVIKSSARYLLSLINDILDFAKVESTQFELEQINFDLNELLTGVVTLLRPIAEQKDVELRLILDSTLPNLLFGDSLRVQQVFFNLIGNAIKFTEQGFVEVTVMAEIQANGKIILRSIVRDTGIGIPPEKIANIFDVFAQVDGSTTRKYGGTGLGLAICLQLVELMKGKIMVESEVGHGSEFKFSLELSQPVSDAPTASPNRGAGRRPQTDADTLGSQRQVQILVAEDNAVNQKLISAILTKRGFGLTMVESGSAALSVAKDRAFDLILMDLQMPGLGGIDACKMIRDGQAPLNTTTPIIALTANAFEEDRLRCLSAGMDGYLSKPINKAALLDTIHSWLAATKECVK